MRNVAVQRNSGRGDISLPCYAYNGVTNMQWTTPAYTDMRFGFEITMYIATR